MSSGHLEVLQLVEENETSQATVEYSGHAQGQKILRETTHGIEEDPAGIECPSPAVPSEYHPLEEDISENVWTEHAEAQLNTRGSSDQALGGAESAAESKAESAAESVPESKAESASGRFRIAHVDTMWRKGHKFPFGVVEVEADLQTWFEMSPEQRVAHESSLLEVRQIPEGSGHPALASGEKYGRAAERGLYAKKDVEGGALGNGLCWLLGEYRGVVCTVPELDKEEAEHKLLGGENFDKAFDLFLSSDWKESLALNAQFKGSCFRFANDCRNMIDEQGEERRQDIVFVEVEVCQTGKLHMLAFQMSRKLRKDAECLTYYGEKTSAGLSDTDSSSESIPDSSSSGSESESDDSEHEGSDERNDRNLTPDQKKVLDLLQQL